VTDIVPFERLDTRQQDEAARVLNLALATMSESYRKIEDAKAEVATFFSDPERFGLAAVEGGHVVGWIGAIRTYDHGWELHPLCVHPQHQRRGLGRMLVRALEAAAKAENICTLYLGSDDEFGGTTIAGADLFTDVVSHIRDIAVTADHHPLDFYRKVGFTVVGLLPDVNGPGKPDILLAKRI
jgi:aminoglycoside 6'-N-acetyltransferase I